MYNTMVAAHTGFGIHPDNTMASFVEGIQSGAHILEVDVRVSQDGVALLQHDDSPVRSAESSGHPTAARSAVSRS